MTRVPLVVVACTALAAGSAAGQGIREPYRPPVPPNRNVNTLPARWWSPGPAMPLYYGAPFGPTYGLYNPWYLPPVVAQSTFAEPREVPRFVPLAGAGVPSAGPALAVDPVLPAEFVVQFPASAEVWLNGKKVDGDDATRTLTSPPLEAGRTYTFDVKAKWTAGGDAYEWARKVTLGAGERSRATVVTGFKVNE